MGRMNVMSARCAISTVDSILAGLDKNGKISEDQLGCVRTYLEHYRYMLNEGIRSAEMPVFFNKPDDGKKKVTTECPE